MEIEAARCVKNKIPFMNPLILALEARKSDVEIHKHSAFQIVLTVDFPFSTICEGKSHNPIFGFVIKPQVGHACHAGISTVVILNIEPYSDFGKALASKFKPNENAVFFYSKKECCDFFGIPIDKFDVYALMNTHQNHKTPTVMDERVNKILSYIRENFNSDTFTLDDLSGLVFLSPSRLTYLFKLQTGSSISKYLVWTRLRNAISLILTKKDQSLSSIAHESGFYDAPQMNKYMSEMFGISPTRLKQKSDLIQVVAQPAT